MSDKMKINPADPHEMKTILRNNGFRVTSDKDKDHNNVKILRDKFNEVRNEEKFVKRFNALTKNEEYINPINYKNEFRDMESKDEFIEAVLDKIKGSLEKKV